MKIVLAILSILAFGWNASSAAIVVTNTNNSGAGSLRQAVINSSDGDTIRFDPTLIAAGSDTILLNTEISFNKGLVFKGLYNSTDTLYVSGQDLTEIFVANLLTTSSLTLVLDSMCLVNGYHPVSGGAVDFRGDKLEIRNSYFFNNRAISYGGAIQAIAKNVTGHWTVEVDISNSKINHNLVYNAAGGGVNISAQQEAFVTVTNSQINFNESLTGPGGGIIIFSNTRSTKISILDSEIDHNIAGDEGGGLYTRSVSNTTSPNPVDSVQLTMINSSVSNNSAQLEGGGIYTNLISNYDNCSYLIQIDNCQINNNSSLDNGGGIYSKSNNDIDDLNSAHISIINSEINGNTAINGGGAYIDSDYTVPGGVSMSVKNSTFDQNSSTTNGGGVYIRGYYSKMEVNRSTFSNNSSQNGGGISFITRYRSLIFLKGLSIEKSTFSTNSATTGGGVYVNFTNPEYESAITRYSTFYNNSATTGGAIYATSTTSIAPYALRLKSSIICVNGANPISAINQQSEGYNIFSNATLAGSVATDQLGVDSLSLNLGQLQNNGGSTWTHMPNIPSPAIDAGDPTNTSSAQNWVITGVRESGAAERASIIYESISATTCDSLISPSGNQTWYADGIYTDTIFGGPNDTLFTVNLTNQTSYSTLVENSCSGSFITPSGNIITTSGIYTDTIPNAFGCDSIISLDITFSAPSSSSINVSECAQYTSPSGNLYTNSGTYTDTLVNSNGCDSIININLIIQQTASSITENVCTPTYTSPSGQVYTVSGIYTDTIPNAANCDSIITIILTMNTPTNSSITVSSCHTYTAPSGIEYFSSGIYFDTISNTAGCDSVISIDLTINTVNTTISNNDPELIAPSGMTSYQWLDCNNNFAPLSGETSTIFIAQQNGLYAVQIDDNGCVDTSSCIAINQVGIFELDEGIAWSVHPNPTKDIVTIQFHEQLREIMIEVVNPLGQLVRRKSYASLSRVEVELESESGLYFVTVISEKGRARIPVVKI